MEEGPQATESATATEAILTPRHRFGKWAQAGVPHKGWECIFTSDAGIEHQICEMCRFRKLRYVHHMRHPAYRGVLKVGSTCAGHMEAAPQAEK
jgi:hypothetical protein